MHTMERTEGSELATGLEYSEEALRGVVGRVLEYGPSLSAAAAATVLVDLLERDPIPCPPHAVLVLLARIAVGDPDAVACGGERHQNRALEPASDEGQAECEMAGRCLEAVELGTPTFLRLLRREAPATRCAAAHLLAFVAPADRAVDDALSSCARDAEQPPAVRAYALFALGIRGTVRPADLPPIVPSAPRPASLLEAAVAFAGLGSKDAPLVPGAESSAIDVLARGVSDRLPFAERFPASDLPFPVPARLLLGRLGRGKGRSARAQSALVQLLGTTAEPARAERIASALLVLAFGEPTAAAFSERRPSLEVFRGAARWSAEQRDVLRAICDNDVLWPASAESGPSVRHGEASAVQVELKRMLELPYYPSRKGVRTAIAAKVSGGGGGAGT